MKYITAALCALFLFSFICRNTYAYDEKTTHPALSDEIVDFYNASFGQDPLTQQQKEWIIEGTVLEDTNPRWINHFYDPVYNRSWTGDNLGFVSPSVVNALSLIGLSTEKRLTAVDWANNYLVQQEYAPYGGNRSWKRGLEYFADGDEKQAYETLGHTLHLLEDMAVPDHTRNDPHPHGLQAVTGETGSPYEDYARKWNRSTIKNLRITQLLRQEGKASPRYTSVEDYLKTVAQYSNKYFFSKDTINHPDYQFPKIVREDENFGYGQDESGKEFPLVIIEKKFDQNRNMAKTYSFKNLGDYNLLFDPYFARLSRQAVLNGAGLIDLFRRQAADAVVNKEFPQHLVKIDISKLTIPTFSLYGEWTRLTGFVQNTVASLYDVAGNLISDIFGSSTISNQESNIPVPSPLVENPSPTPRQNTVPVDTVTTDGPKKTPSSTPILMTVKLSTSSVKLAQTESTSSKHQLVFFGGAPPPIINSESARSELVEPVVTEAQYSSQQIPFFENSASSSIDTQASSSASSSAIIDESTSTTSTTVEQTNASSSGFFDHIYFYKDPRAGADRYILDLTENPNKPLWDINNTNNSKISIVIFYLNQDVPDQRFVEANNGYIPEGAHVLGLSYGSCNGTAGSPAPLLIPFNREACVGAGTYSGALSIYNLEKQRVFISTAQTQNDIVFSKDDFITMGLYEYDHNGPVFALSTADNTRHYFQNTPPLFSNPTTPSSLTLNFDVFHSVLNINWSSSTDPDTPGNAIRYKINISSSSDLQESNWQSTGRDLSWSTSVTYPNAYIVGVRAIDDFGNISETVSRTWNFPAGYFALPSQLNHDAWLGGLGSRQKITMNSTVSISGIALWIGPDGGQYCCSPGFLELHADEPDSNAQQGSRPGVILATSAPAGMGQYEAPHELLYPFDVPVTLEAGHAYWLMPQQMTPGNGSRVFGSDTDTYPGGFWSANPAQDIYFRLKKVGE